MPQSRSVPLDVQLVQMFGQLMPMYRMCARGMEFVAGCYRPVGVAGAARCTNRAGSFARCIAVPLQGGIEAVDQGFSGERFGQETGRFRLQGSYASVVKGEGTDENEGYAVSLGKQMGLQLETAHRRHLNIGDHARSVIQVRRPQEFLGRSECMNDVSERPHEIAGRATNGAVIVND
jgi:hypothetical protein